MSSYEDAGLVFTSEAGTLDKLTNPRRRSFVSLLEKARGHRVSFHDLGHTCATLLFSRNVHPIALCNGIGPLLLHSSDVGVSGVPNPPALCLKANIARVVQPH